VQVLADATHDAMIQALRAFESEADRADWGVVYYAGHGMEIGGVNYIHASFMASALSVVLGRAGRGTSTRHSRPVSMPDTF
jgi:uncharacterized caspase-like protein